MPHIAKAIEYSFILIWVLFSLNLTATLFGSVNLLVYWIGITLIAVHFLELLLVFGKLKSKGHGAKKIILSVLAFGVLYWRPLLKN